MNTPELNIMEFVFNIRKLKAHWHFIVLIIAILIYILYWSYITIYRIITFQAGVYDLGLMQQEFYLTLNSHSLSGWLIAFLNKDTALIFAPIYFLHSLSAIVILQTIFLGMPALLIYAISLHVLKNRNYSLTFSLIYLVYPLLYGVNWFDAHNQAFLIFFFLLGFYLFIREKYKLSVLFLLLSGLTHYLLLGLPILFSLPFIYESIVSGSHNKKRNNYALIVLVLSFTLLVVTYFIDQSIDIELNSTVHAGNLNFFAYFPDKILTLFLALAPLGFLSIYPNRYILLLLPFFSIMFISSQTTYFIPGILTDQYASSLIPGIFISAIYGLSTLKKKREKTQNMARKVVKFKNMISKNILKGAVLSTIIIVLILAPFSPIVNHSNLYKTELPISKYSKLYEEFSAEVKLIPGATPYVVIGDNEPTILPLPQLNNAPLLVTPYTLTYNLSYKQLNGLTYRNATINYVIGNPYGGMFTQSLTSPYNLSMYDLLSKLYDSGSFGIVAEASGIILLERNYTGPLQYYVPINCTFGSAYMQAPIILGNLPISSSNYLLTTNNPILVNNSIQLNGPMFLPPGEYNFSFSLSSITSNNLYQTNFSIQSPGFIQNFSANIVSKVNKSIEVNLRVRVSTMIENSRIGIVIRTGGPLFVNYLNITQVTILH